MWVKQKGSEEESLQKGCVFWFDYQYPEYRKLLHHSPNGGYRITKEAEKFKKMGVRAGFPDLILLVPRGGCPFLAIELKSAKGEWRDSQKEYMQAVLSVGGRYEVVRTFDRFKELVEDYLGKRK